MRTLTLIYTVPILLAVLYRSSPYEIEIMSVDEITRTVESWRGAS